MADDTQPDPQASPTDQSIQQQINFPNAQNLQDGHTKLQMPNDHADENTHVAPQQGLMDQAKRFFVGQSFGDEGQEIFDQKFKETGSAPSQDDINDEMTKRHGGEIKGR